MIRNNWTEETRKKTIFDFICKSNGRTTIALGFDEFIQTIDWQQQENKYHFSLNREKLEKRNLKATTPPPSSFPNSLGQSSTNIRNTQDAHARSRTRSNGRFILDCFLWLRVCFDYYVAFEWNTGFVLFSIFFPLSASLSLRISSHSHCFHFNGFFVNAPKSVHTHTTRAHTHTHMTERRQRRRLIRVYMAHSIVNDRHVDLVCLAMPPPSAKYQYTNTQQHAHK